VKDFLTDFAGESEEGWWWHFGSVDVGVVVGWMGSWRGVVGRSLVD